MSFDVGQIVVVSKPSTTYAEQFKNAHGAVTNIVEDEPFAYELTFANGRTLGFAEGELSPLGGDHQDADDDEVNHPSHYRWLPNGVEVIDITENLNFNLGNVVKYVLRAGHKTDEPLTDLRKAAWYINREIVRLETS
ncbi:DUF3310 domain-containing protein [Streptomyces prunicolor]|uniref:DUF3310 domain-containing protein n=1 Tax=Streptomyces prunicolor TaxID=67348 RepID=UPI0033EC0F3F